jgi:hydrogenase maturation protein HypF
MGRLFDTAAALLGFTREITFEGQAAMWVEHLARGAKPGEPYPFPLIDGELDFRPLLEAMVFDRLRGREHTEIARAFQLGVALGLYQAAGRLCADLNVDTVVLSGGVFQNGLLLRDLRDMFLDSGLQVWTNSSVPANDGGISLGQAAIASISHNAPAVNGRLETLASVE